MYSLTRGKTLISERPSRPPAPTSLSRTQGQGRRVRPPTLGGRGPFKAPVGVEGWGDGTQEAGTALGRGKTLMDRLSWGETYGGVRRRAGPDHPVGYRIQVSGLGPKQQQKTALVVYHTQGLGPILGSEGLATPPGGQGQSGGGFKKGGGRLSGHWRSHRLVPQMGSVLGQRAKDARVKLLLLGKRRS